MGKRKSEGPVPGVRMREGVFYYIEGQWKGPLRRCCLSRGLDEVRA